jgi:hypothetical protein
MMSYKSKEDTLDVKVYDLEKGKLYYDRAKDFITEIDISREL